MALSQKYGDEISSQSKFNLAAWETTVGGLKTTRTHVYEYSIRVLAFTVLAPAMTFESACGVKIARPLLHSTPKPEGYHQLVININHLMISMGNVNHLL